MEKIIDALFPPTCFGCREGGGHICFSCMQECKVARYYYCIVCDKPSIMGKTHEYCLSPLTPFSIFTPFEYKGLVRKCIMRAKYRSKLFAPLKMLSQEAADNASQCGVVYKDFIVVPIPLSVRRAKERGFNQAGLIALAVAEKFTLTYRDSILARGKETRVQHKKTREERFKNLKGAFLASQKVRGKKILLVDDICTTGATLLEAAKVLKQAGAPEIRCFTLAKEF